MKRTQESHAPNLINHQRTYEVSCTIEEAPDTGHDADHERAEPKICVDNLLIGYAMVQMVSQKLVTKCRFLDKKGLLTQDNE